MDNKKMNSILDVYFRKNQQHQNNQQNAKINQQQQQQNTLTSKQQFAQPRILLHDETSNQTINQNIQLAQLPQSVFKQKRSQKQTRPKSQNLFFKQQTQQDFQKSLQLNDKHQQIDSINNDLKLQRNKSNITAKLYGTPQPKFQKMQQENVEDKTYCILNMYKNQKQFLNLKHINIQHSVKEELDHGIQIFEQYGNVDYELSHQQKVK